MSNSSGRIVAALVSLVLSTQAAAAQITWNWTIGGYAGQFITNGFLDGGVAPAGTYTLQDFIVSNGHGLASTGSWTGGQYLAEGFCTEIPYTMNWDGSAVTSWSSAGCNTFDWWVFDDLATDNYFVFGWATGNVNDPTEGAYLGPPYFNQTPSHLIVVDDQAIVTPEPATISLLAVGLVALGVILRRRKVAIGS